MKTLIILALVLTSVAAMGQQGRTKDQEAESASRRLLQKKREKTMPMIVKPQEQTERPRNDADPSLAPVDDELTKDEGLKDD